MGEAVEVLLEIRGLHKSFEDRKVLQQINLDVTKGEVVVVLGPSGCGKSTLLRCLNGLEPVQSGDIRYRGQDLTDKKVNWREVRQHIGMVFQNYELFPHMTVLENILLGRLKFSGEISRRHLSKRSSYWSEWVCWIAKMRIRDNYQVGKSNGLRLCAPCV